MAKPVDAETARLQAARNREARWQRWGPYLSDRQWGTVREDYSAEGDPWRHFPHDQARSRAYRWGEDGLLGICDRQCRLCFGLALWNGRDPILKERLFGLTNPEGNHGEDVKEVYEHLDATPSASYLAARYLYPQAPFPYAELVAENGRRGRHDREYELMDTGVFSEGRYFEVTVEYAKAAPEDIRIRIAVTNRGPESARLDVLPQLWFRNQWSWPPRHEAVAKRPWIAREGERRLGAWHESLGRFGLAADEASCHMGWLFADNVSNTRRLWGVEPASPTPKDAFHERVVADRPEAVAAEAGTKAAAWSSQTLEPGATRTLRLRLCRLDGEGERLDVGEDLEEVFEKRIAEADAFHAERCAQTCDEEDRWLSRRAYAGLLWSQQFYHYVVEDWLTGDAAQPAPPPERRRHPNARWGHLYNRDVIAMPDKWEYPWYAAWDLAFHTLPLARMDLEEAKRQLMVMLREWYMHPNGQLPAYEFNFSDVNPPVHAWACLRVYRMSERGPADRAFLESAFQKLVMNFTWWVNREDEGGNNLFAGGFLGLDNIGVFDRSKPVAGGRLEQADGTAWMGFFCANMLAIALELAPHNRAYEDMASKFFEHFVQLIDAINSVGGSGLWNEEDGFYYDHLRIGDEQKPIRARSLVGLLPLLAAQVIERSTLERLPGFRRRTEWFLANRSDLARYISFMQGSCGEDQCYLMAMPTEQRLRSVLSYVLDEEEFLSPYGIRSLSRVYGDHPHPVDVGGETRWIRYEPGESETDLFGGNSNWRGPVWFPVNVLLIEAIKHYHHFYGDRFRIACPTGADNALTLNEVADELTRRLVGIFRPDEEGRRPFQGEHGLYRDDPLFRDQLLFYEYFHGESGRGCGASHQTGWTALIALLLNGFASS